MSEDKPKDAPLNGGKAQPNPIAQRIKTAMDAAAIEKHTARLTKSSGPRLVVPR